jgi:anti-anti-sigma factor
MAHGHGSPLDIDVSWDGVVATVTVAGELDITTATPLTRRLLAVGAERPERLVLDLSGLVFVDVAGARALDEVHTLLRAECPVILRQPRPSARMVFRLTGLMTD